MSRSHHRPLFFLALTLAFIVLCRGQLSAKESPWYTALSLGQTVSEVGLGSIHRKVVDDEAPSGSVSLGYQISRYLAIEAGYHDLGDHQGSGSPCRQGDDACIERLVSLGLCVEGSICPEVLAPIDVDITGFSLILVPQWPLTERVTAFGRAGVLGWESSLSARTFGYAETLSGDDLLVGAGIKYGLSDRLGLLLAYEHVDLDLRTASLGLQWRF